MTVRPWRRGSAEPPPAVPLPPAPLPALRGSRPLKRWCWVGVFGADVMLCAAVARIGPLPLSWWAVWDREQRTLAERTGRGRPIARVTPQRVAVADGIVAVDLELGDGTPIEVVSPHGAQYAWTRKRGGVSARGTVRIGERVHDVDARAFVDESAGYHARRTSWRWSAGVGVAASGAPVAWNLVEGLHDDPDVSERTVWVDGEPHHVPPQPFHGLEGVGGLRFEAEAVRAHAENRLLVVSDYEQPFGTFSGELPVAGALRSGFGVMERHDVRW